MATAEMDLGDIAKMKGSIQCEVPHHQLYVFKATMTLDAEPDTAIALDQSHLLLQVNLTNLFAKEFSKHCLNHDHFRALFFVIQSGRWGSSCMLDPRPN